MEQHLQKKILTLTTEIGTQDAEMTELKEGIDKQNTEKEEII